MNSYRFFNIFFKLFAAVPLLSLLSLLLTAGGCSDDFLPEPPAADGLVLSFYNSERTTRATDPSDGSLNETRLQSIAVALYADGAGDDAPPVKFARFSGFDAADGRWQTKMSISDSEAAALFGTVADGATCRLFAVANLSGDALTELEAMTKPTVNDLKAIAIDSEFAARQVQELFVMSGDDRVRLSIDAAGAKSAVGSVELVRTAAKITLSLNIEKEITETDADGNKTVYSPLLPSEENPSTIRVLLNNGVGKSLVVPSASHTPADEDYFSLTTGSEAYVFKNSTDTEYPFTQAIPFYTYPNSWSNTPEELHRTAMTLIIPWLRSTVKTDGSTDTSVTTRYYTVPVTPASMPQILSNNSYRIDLNVGMLGSEQPDKPEDITANYRVVSWATEDIDVDINDYRYLVVSPHTYTMDNTEDFNLSFYSSHPVEVEEITMTFLRFAYVSENDNSDMGKVVSFTADKAVIDRSVSGSEKMVEYSEEISPLPNQKKYSFTLRHKFLIWTPVNSESATTITGVDGEVTESDGVRYRGNQVLFTGYTSLKDTAKVEKAVKKYLLPENPETAYSKYVFRITLRHKDKKDMKSTFTVVQYPAMYIEAVNNPRNGPNSNHPGNNFINGGSDQSDTGGLGTISKLTGTNRNPNMYIINVSTLGNASGYYIGDPRSLYIDNTLYTRDYSTLPERTSDGPAALYYYDSDYYRDTYWCRLANSLYYIGNNENRTLTYYYPTIESMDKSHSMMIAPKIRVASSYATTDGINRNKARRRCATYQEENCPSGRWRLPTYGEMLYIVNLSAKGIIPTLFTIGKRYWTAQGAYLINDDGTLTKADDTKNGTVRPVYDEWYWEKETDYIIEPDWKGSYTYTFGDMPKRNPQD